MGAIPLDGARQAFVEADFGLPFQLRKRLRAVGQQALDLARLGARALGINLDGDARVYLSDDVAGQLADGNVFAAA